MYFPLISGWLQALIKRKREEERGEFCGIVSHPFSVTFTCIIADVWSDINEENMLATWHVWDILSSHTWHKFFPGSDSYWASLCGCLCTWRSKNMARCALYSCVTEIILRLTWYMSPLQLLYSTECVLRYCDSASIIYFSCSVSSVFHLLCDLVLLWQFLIIIVNNNAEFTKYSFCAQ